MLTSLSLAVLVRNFRHNRAGTAAVEFAFTLPALTAAVIGLSDASSIGDGASKMQTAVRASIQYVMNGGASLDTAKSQGLQAWVGTPSDGTLTVTQACLCGGAAGACGTTCPDGSIPSRYITAVASGTLGGDMLHYKKTVSEAVRIQ